MIEYKTLSVTDIVPDMLINFNHYQRIKKKWVRNNKVWELRDASDMREWNHEKRIWITEYLRRQIERGGSVVVAFNGDIIVGFCCVDGYLLGKTAKYANMTMLFVDDNWKRKGIGKKLFHEICKCAVNMQADKLYISAIPSVETIAFYFSMGCEDTKEMIADYMDTENDRYLEYLLWTTNRLI